MEKFKKRYVLYGILALISIFIMYFSFNAVRILFFSETVVISEFTNDYNDFMTAYENTISDLPEGIIVEKTAVEVDKENGSYYFAVTIKNTNGHADYLSCQIYHDENMIDEYGTDPLARETMVMISGGASYTFDFNSIILSDVNSFEEDFKNVYLEIKFSQDMGRIYIPVGFTDNTIQ